MKHTSSFLLLALTVLFVCLSFHVSYTRANNCLGCTIAARVVYQFMEEQEPNAEKALFKLCDMLSPKLSAPCKLFVSFEGYVFSHEFIVEPLCWCAM